MAMLIAKMITVILGIFTIKVYVHNGHPHE